MWHKNSILVEKHFFWSKILGLEVSQTEEGGQLLPKFVQTNLLLFGKILFVLALGGGGYLLMNG